MSDEQRVRTMCGWIGVEISRSRVRTPGKAGYGLYRVRGSLPVLWSIKRGDAEIDRSPGQGQPTLWTAYAFTLEQIERAVRTAIECGTPAGPQAMGPRDSLTGETVAVPTRWTSAYRGRRDLGVAPKRVNVPCESGYDPSKATECTPCRCITERETPRTRQRAYNAEFQREHLRRRAWGLKRRHARKLERNGSAPSQGEAERQAQRGRGVTNGGGSVGREG